MAKPRDVKDVKELIKKHDVKFVRLWFCDIHGMLKGFAIPVEELDFALEEGMGFDGSSIKGFARIDESDMIARPDTSTFALLPWRPKEKGVARMFCDIYEPDGTPYKGDPRYVLKRNLEKASKKGYTFYLGPELEYFYFNSDKCPEILDEGGYFDYTTSTAEDLRRETILALEQMGISVEYAHHEVAPSQHEIDLRYSDALTMADTVMTYRVVVKEIARKYGYYATFMPKPLFGQNGSGMHTHQSLFKGKSNAFFNAKDKYYLSDIAKKYIAGVLAHVREITLVLNQWVNSYKRLVPGYEAPVYICWARRNRSALVRVPLYKPGKEKATRIELRSPDPACNPYLAFSCMLNAGLSGVDKGYKLPDPTEVDVYHLTADERQKMGIEELPGSLIEAIELAEKSDLLRDTLGDHIFNELLMSKRTEWDNYRTKIFPYELDTYLPML
ncbi:MAG: type I glutamate--ammonia ligase [Thermodesulfovibrionales bacterium]